MSNQSSLAAVTGAQGTPLRLELPAGVGLTGLRWGEFRDQPCLLLLVGDSVASPSSPRQADRNTCPDVQIPPNVRFGARGPAFTPGERTFVTGVQVCMNADGTRVKGARLRGHRLTAQGRLVSIAERPTHTLPNCDGDWRAWSDCPAGALASGVVMHVEAGRAPRSMTGFQLVCRAVIATPAPRTYAFTGPAVDAAGVSGFRGEAVRLLPGGNGQRALDTIAIAEQRDRPCLVQTEGRTLNSALQRAAAQVSFCLEDRSAAPSRIEAEAATVGRVITGVRVCLNARDNRVKGLEIEVRELGDPSRVSVVHALQEHCRSQAQWSRQVRCAPGHAAVGLIAHVAAGDRPRSLTGLGLVCRPYAAAI